MLSRVRTSVCSLPLCRHLTLTWLMTEQVGTVVTHLRYAYIKIAFHVYSLWLFVNILWNPWEAGPRTTILSLHLHCAVCTKKISSAILLLRAPNPLDVMPRNCCWSQVCVCSLQDFHMRLPVGDDPDSTGFKNQGHQRVLWATICRSIFVEITASLCTLFLFRVAA
jgi:hypothetical protein